MYNICMYMYLASWEYKLLFIALNIKFRSWDLARLLLEGFYKFIYEFTIMLLVQITG
jgi:hypothetical protein